MIPIRDHSGMKIAGFQVKSETVTVVVANYSGNLPLVIEATHDWPLQNGGRPQAYSVLCDNVIGYLKGQHVERAVLKSSAANPGRAGVAHLLAAEVRGIVQVACVKAQCDVTMVDKAMVSRGQTRKVEEYLKDDGFWQASAPSLRRRGDREAAILILAALGEL